MEEAKRKGHTHALAQSLDLSILFLGSQMQERGGGGGGGGDEEGPLLGLLPFDIFISSLDDADDDVRK